VLEIYKDKEHTIVSHYRCVSCGEKRNERFGEHIVHESKVERKFFISTGKKSVMFTLWKDCSSDVYMGKSLYIKNLPIKEEKAIKEAEKYAIEHKGIFLGVFDSPERKRSKFFDFAGIHFRESVKNGKTFFVGIVTEEFWKLWREKKEELKQEGYRVSKFKETWYVFKDDIKNLVGED
jgi:hypothetical protein